MKVTRLVVERSNYYTTFTQHSFRSVASVRVPANLPSVTHLPVHRVSTLRLTHGGRVRGNTLPGKERCIYVGCQLLEVRRRVAPAPASSHSNPPSRGQATVLLSAHKLQQSL
jgi:hypothetical protein